MSGTGGALRVRTASSDDITQICTIDRSATAKFGSIPELADLAEAKDSAPNIQQWLAVGRIYLVVDEQDHALGFIAAHPMDGVLYIAEISTSADHQGKGIGSMLLSSVFQWALVRCTHDGTPTARVSLTTYADVPWNGPWYLKRGFKEVDAATIGSSHVYKMTCDKEERDLVRPGYRRCCMLWEAVGSEGLE